MFDRIHWYSRRPSRTDAFCSGGYWFRYNRYRPIQIISPCINFGSIVFQEIDPFYLNYQVCRHKVVHSVLYLYCFKNLLWWCCLLSTSYVLVTEVPALHRLSYLIFTWFCLCPLDVPSQYIVCPNSCWFLTTHLPEEHPCL